jgi:ABC-2 type transport system permease protein
MQAVMEDRTNRTNRTMEAMSQLAFDNSLQDILLPLGILLLFAAVLLAMGMFFLQPNRVSN